MTQGELFQEGICPCCSLWFCDDQECRRKLAIRERGRSEAMREIQRAYEARNRDRRNAIRREHSKNYYRLNRERLLAYHRNRYERRKHEKAI
jgi:hypothetical protein